MNEPLNRRQLHILALTGAALALFVAMFFVIGGAYGLAALSWGRNPLRLTPPTRGALEESRQRGDEIIAAITRFHRDRGAYPQALTELVPAYLVELRQPTVGLCRWEYVKEEKRGFVLRYFVGPMYEAWWYEGIPGEWKVDM